MPNKCPNPMFIYTFDRRNHPDICPKCSVFLGPPVKTNVKEKRKKPLSIPNPKHVTVNVGGGLYSVQYHHHNRCIVQIVDGDEMIHFCDQKKCAEIRRFNVRNSTQFLCAHIEKVLEALEHDVVISVYVFSLSTILFFDHFGPSGRNLMMPRQSF